MSDHDPPGSAITMSRNTHAARTHLQEALVLATELGRPLIAHCHLGLGSSPGLRAGGTESAQRARG
jgi:hypothetical protein